jgi:hypothetical protein
MSFLTMVMLVDQKKSKEKKSGHNRNARVLMLILNLLKENLAYWNPL